MSDALARIAARLTEIGECYQLGRRYRAIAAVCEEQFLEHALEIGSDVRAAGRRAGLDAAAADAILAQLAEISAACRSAIVGAQASALYRRAVAAWEAADWAAVGRLAPAVFAAVESHSGVDRSTIRCRSRPGAAARSTSSSPLHARRGSPRPSPKA